MYPKDSLAGLKATKTNNKAGVTPVLVLCDNSGSMKNYVKTVNDCISNLIKDLQSDSVLSGKISLAIYCFNCECSEVLPFTKVADIKQTMLTPIKPEDWATYFGKALLKAVGMLSHEKNEYKKANIQYNQPNLIVISDGVPEHEDVTTTEQGIGAIQEKINRERWNCIPIFIGHESPGNIMGRICVPDQDGQCDYIKFDSTSKKNDIVSAFKFASMSIAAVGNDGGTDTPMSTTELKERIRRRKSFRDGMKFN